MSAISRQSNNRKEIPVNKDIIKTFCEAKHQTAGELKFSDLPPHITMGNFTDLIFRFSDLHADTAN